MVDPDCWLVTAPLLVAVVWWSSLDAQHPGRAKLRELVELDRRAMLSVGHSPTTVERVQRSGALAMRYALLGLAAVTLLSFMAWLRY